MSNSIKKFVDYGGAYFIAAVLFTAAMLKAYNLSSFSFYLTSITFVPEPWRSRLALIVPLLEICGAFLLLMGPTRRLGQILSAVMLLVFIGFLVKMVTDPYSPSCSCFGVVTMANSAHKANIVALIRNAVLLIVCISSFLCGVSMKAESICPK